MNNGTTKWAAGMVLAILLGSVGWVIGLSKPSSEQVEKNVGRITTLERRVDVNDSNYKHILDRLEKIDKKLESMK